MEEITRLFQDKGGKNPKPGPSLHNGTSSSPEEQCWEMVMDKKLFKLWRRPIGGTHLYQYRGRPCCSTEHLPATYKAA